MFDIVSSKIPRFMVTLRSLTLHSPRYVRAFDGSGKSGESWGDIFHPSRSFLSSTLTQNYTKLTSFKMLSCDHIHLNTLPPSLRLLRLVTPFAHCDCTNTLPHLEAFSVAPYRKEPVDFARLLPFHSKSTVTKCDILFTEWQSDHVDEMKLLINFVHITDLAITPMTAAMCQVLVGYSLRLNSFSTQSYVPHQLHTGPLLDLLSSPVLAEATTLRYAKSFSILGGHPIDIRTVH